MNVCLEEQEMVLENIGDVESESDCMLGKGLKISSRMDCWYSFHESSGTKKARQENL